MKRIIALLLAAMLALSLAACGRSEPAAATEAPTETAADTAATAEAETSTAAQTEETTAVETSASPEATTTMVEQSSSAALQAPTDKTQILALYNDAIAKPGSLSRTLYSWDILTAVFANVRIAGIRQDDIDSLENISEPYRFYRDSQRTAHDLVRLTDAQVASAALKKQDGKLATYELQLKPATADQSMQNGYAGYPGLVAYSEIIMLLDLAADGASYTASIDKFSLSNGKLLVAIDLESGAVQSAEFSFTEDAVGPLRLYVVGTADIVLKFDVRAAYKA